MTADVTRDPTGGQGLRFRLVDSLWSHQVWAFNGTQVGCSCDHRFRAQAQHREHLADVVLALPELAALIADADNWRRVTTGGPSPDATTALRYDGLTYGECY